MSKGWRLMFQTNVSDELKDVMIKKLINEHSSGLNRKFLYPAQIDERMSPGRQRKQDKKDAIRRFDRVKVREIISGIFYRKQVKYPARDIKGLKWNTTNDVYADDPYRPEDKKQIDSD
jgi:signal recognition particle subunit SEC65